MFKRCVTAQDAANPERWMARQNEKGDCKLTPGESVAVTVAEDARNSLIEAAEARLENGAATFRLHDFQLSSRHLGDKLLQLARSLQLDPRDPVARSELVGGGAVDR